jgi:hypothetical protein
MLGTLPQVAVEGDGAFGTERGASGPIVSAAHPGDTFIEFDVVHVQPDQLVVAHPGVEQYADHGGVSPAPERPVGVDDFQQPVDVLVFDGRDGLLGHLRRLHSSHRRSRDLALVEQPLEPLLPAPVTVVGGRRLPPVDQSLDERLNVLPGHFGRLGWHPLGLQEGEEPAGGLSVGFDRPLALSLGSQRPLKRGDQSGQISYLDTLARKHARE